MQAIILAAGKGTRMGHLTENVPKPLLMFGEKTLLAHKLERLPEVIDGVIIVIGHKGDLIKRKFGNSFSGKKLVYVRQEVLNGTGGALMCAKEYLDDRFIVMMGDDIYSPADIKECSKHNWAILVNRVDRESVGARVISCGGSLLGIDEKVRLFPGDLCNTGMYALRKKILDIDPVDIGNGECGLPQMLVKIAQSDRVEIIESKDWISITSEKDLMVMNM